MEMQNINHGSNKIHKQKQFEKASYYPLRNTQFIQKSGICQSCRMKCRRSLWSHLIFHMQNNQNIVSRKNISENSQIDHTRKHFKQVVLFAF